MVTEKLAEIMGWKVGYLLHEGFEVKCAGTEGTDADGAPIISDRHLICTLDDHLPGTEAHAIGNPEFTDDLWTLDSAQDGIDWSNPKCCICSQPPAP